MKPQIKQKETKLFKHIYSSYPLFEKTVIEPLLKMHSVLPDYLDEHQTFYSFETLYGFLANKYDDFYAVNSVEKTHKLMQNAFAHLLPVLHLKTKQLTPEFMALFRDPKKLFETIEKRYNENPKVNYASTETVYSSTPDSSQVSGTFNLKNVKEKNVISRSDATIKLREVTNLIDKLSKFGSVNISGYVYDFINSFEISSLWESDLSYVDVLIGDGKFATGEFAYNVEIDSQSPDSLLTQKVVDSKIEKETHFNTGEKLQDTKIDDINDEKSVLSQKEIDKKLHNLGNNFNDYIDKNLLFQNNSKDIKELGNIDIHLQVSNPKKIPSRQEVQNLGKSVFGEIKGSNSNIDMTKLEERTDDYLNNKADFVRVDDLVQTIKRQFLNETWVENGNNLELDLTNIDMSKFKTPNLISIKSQGANQSIYIEDSYNDGNSTDQTINVNNNNETIQVEITNNKAIIKSMKDEQRQWWTTNMKPIYIEQVGTGSSSIDQIARNEIVDEVKKRQLEDTLLSNRINTNKTDISTNKNNKIDKQLVQNNDFSTWAELLNLIHDDDFVNISLASGEYIYGHIFDKGTNTITLNGARGDDTYEYYGKVKLNDQWHISGGSSETNHYFKLYSNYLTENHKTATRDAFIGKGYHGKQYYGELAIGSQHYGHGATGSQLYGYAAIGNQHYGDSAKGKQYYGHNSTGPLSIHMSEKGIKNKIEFKQNANKEMAIYIDGTERVTIRDLVNNLHAKPQGYVGKFSSFDKLQEFMATTTNVDNDQFKDEAELTSVSLTSVKYIGNGAFKNSPLTLLNIPNAVYIGNDTFKYSKLTALDLPNATSIGEYTFFFSELKTLSLPKVTIIGIAAFYGSTLTSLNLPNVSFIGGSAFFTSKITSLYLPSATYIDEGAFVNSPLTYLKIPKVTLIGNNSFRGEPAFKSIVNSPSTRVIMPGGPDRNGVPFNSTKYKDYMFGPGNWDQITFTWL